MIKWVWQLPNWWKKILHLRVKTDEETGQTILSGMGELHLEIIIDRMRREFKVEINQGAPQVAYKEAFTKTIEHRETLEKANGWSW